MFVQIYQTLTGIKQQPAFVARCRYNPDTDSWSADVAPLSSPRGGVCMVAMDGYLFAIGGHDSTTAINTVERYNSMGATRDQYPCEPLNTLEAKIKTLEPH